MGDDEVVCSIEVSDRPTHADARRSSTRRDKDQSRGAPSSPRPRTGGDRLVRLGYGSIARCDDDVMPAASRHHHRLVDDDAEPRTRASSAQGEARARWLVAVLDSVIIVLTGRTTRLRFLSDIPPVIFVSSVISPSTTTSSWQPASRHTTIAAYLASRGRTRRMAAPRLDKQRLGCQDAV